MSAQVMLNNTAAATATTTNSRLSRNLVRSGAVKHTLLASSDEIPMVIAAAGTMAAVGIETLPLVTGWSMGAAETYQWAVSYPEMVQRALPFCGSSKTSEHNVVFLEGVKSALTADAAFKEGWYTEKPTKGLRAAARVYAGWGFSQAFYWRQEYKKMGYSSLEDFLVGFWEGFFLDRRDPNNLLAMLWTWQNGNVGATPGRGFNGDQVAALKTIKAKMIVMPAEKDLYFPPEDEKFAVNHIPNAELRVIPGVYGHFAGRRRKPRRQRVHRRRPQGTPGELSISNLPFDGDDKPEPMRHRDLLVGLVLTVTRHWLAGVSSG